MVWCDESGNPVGFQLCYKDGNSEYALTWNSEGGLTHKIIDDGEQRPGKHKATPILAGNVPFSPKLISERFAQVSGRLPLELADFVREKMREGPIQ